jgi:hypothetical protein
MRFNLKTLMLFVVFVSIGLTCAKYAPPSGWTERQVDGELHNVRFIGLWCLSGGCFSLGLGGLLGWHWGAAVTGLVTSLVFVGEALFWPLVNRSGPAIGLTIVFISCAVTSAVGAWLMRGEWRHTPIGLVGVAATYGAFLAFYAR